MKLTEVEKVMVAAIGGLVLAERDGSDEDNAAQVPCVSGCSATYNSSLGKRG